MSATKYTLSVHTGPQEGMAFDLDQETIILGRDETNDIILPDAEVSRRHSRLTLSPQGYVLEDLGSTNGTFVNGERLSGPHLLIPDDQIGLSQKLVLSYEMTSEGKTERVPFKRAVESEFESEAMPFVDPIVDTPEKEAAQSVEEDVASLREDFEVIKEAAPKKKRRVNRWMIAGIGCAVLVVVCGAIFWYMDMYYDSILYAPLYSLMRLLGFQ